MTLRIKPVGTNQTELHTSEWIVFFSYETPVAAYNKQHVKSYRTTKKFSVTTSKHINQWLGMGRGVGKVEEISQAEIERILENW